MASDQSSNFVKFSNELNSFETHLSSVIIPLKYTIINKYILKQQIEPVLKSAKPWNLIHLHSDVAQNHEANNMLSASVYHQINREMDRWTAMAFRQ